jgi:hypothetical protein
VENSGEFAVLFSLCLRSVNTKILCAPTNSGNFMASNTCFDTTRFTVKFYCLQFEHISTDVLRNTNNYKRFQSSGLKAKINPTCK